MSPKTAIIIGAGPAGLTAAVYARRAGKSALVLEKASFGGQITYSPKIENFPSAVSRNTLSVKSREGSPLSSYQLGITVTFSGEISRLFTINFFIPSLTS